MSGFGVTMAPGDATLNGAVPPVIVNPKLLLVQLFTPGPAVTAGGVTCTGPVGTTGVAVPTVLTSVAVVWRPIASTIVNVSGLTHAPLVIASNEPPEKLTVELTKITASGKVDETWYGGVPP